MSKVWVIGVLVACLCCVPQAQQVTGVTASVLWTPFNRAGSSSSNGQCFTPANVALGSGLLTLTALIQSATCSSIDEAPETLGYTAGYVAMRSFNFLYGTVEFRAKFGPCNGASCTNVGYWPSVWMNSVGCQASDPTGTDNNCDEGEIDIAELWGDFTHINQALHRPDSSCGYNCGGGVTAGPDDMSTHFHVYDLVWTSGSLSWYIDGTLTTGPLTTGVPTEAYYVKMDQFVGGAIGGAINNASFPWLEQIDYLKVGFGCSGVNPMSGCSSIPFDDEFY
jgi:beta-glucanase (GH16 family)